jgi:hypothetical protein
MRVSVLLGKAQGLSVLDTVTCLGTNSRRRRVARKVKDLKHPITHDIDVTRREDVSTLDGFVNTCIAEATDALRKTSLAGFSDDDRQHIANLIEGVRHSHQSIRKLLKGDRNASAVDALAIARLQLETLYTTCYLLQDPEHIQLFMKNSWKKKYIRFLLGREEHRNLSRFDDYYNNTGLAMIGQLQRASNVTDDERKTIDIEELGTAFTPMPTITKIPAFPTPGKALDQITNANQKRMLERLYPEYQFLCSFAHGDAESVLFRAVSDPRSKYQSLFSTAAIEDFYQRQVLEQPIIYSALSALQIATEVAAVYPTSIELAATVTKAWTFLTQYSLQVVPTYEIRAKTVLNII